MDDRSCGRKEVRDLLTKIVRTQIGDTSEFREKVAEAIREKFRSEEDHRAKYESTRQWPHDGTPAVTRPSTSSARMEVPTGHRNPAIARHRAAAGTAESAVEKIVDRRSARTSAATG